MGESGQGSGRQYLTFRLGEEIYGIEVSRVREILEVGRVTSVPLAPDHLYGVINLRGSVVPVIDLRKKFGMPAAVRTITTCIVVVETEVEGEATVAGALADAVEEVFELPDREIEPPPRIGIGGKSDFVVGMVRHRDGFLMILDMDRVFRNAPLMVAPPAGGTAGTAAASGEAP